MSTIRPRLIFKNRTCKLRKNATLDATTAILNQKGDDLMSMDDVTGTAGLAKPSLYKHVQSKEELVGEVLIRRIDGALDGVSRPVSEPSGASDCAQRPI